MAREGSKEERRARQARLARNETVRTVLKRGGIVLAIILVIAGAAYGISLLPKQPGQVHWHAKYRVFADGQQVSFASPRFDGMNYAEAHLHSPNFDLIHNEGREGRGTMGRFFEFTLGGKLSDNEMTLPQGSSRPGDYATLGNATLRMFVSNQDANQRWTPVTTDLAGTSFHDGERILIVYGNETADEIANYEASFPDFSAKGQSKTMPTAPPTGS